MNRLSHLIEALQIFLKYGDPAYPTHCEHDVMYVMTSPNKVSKEDTIKLSKLGFNPKKDTECFESFWFGSA